VTLKTKVLLIAIIAGLSFGALALQIPALGKLSPVPAIAALQHAALNAVLPGLLLSIAISGDTHTYSLPAAALGNFLFYFFLCWAAGQVVLLILKRQQAQLRKATELPRQA
jgi:hypothetical protein